MKVITTRHTADKMLTDRWMFLISASVDKLLQLGNGLTIAFWLIHPSSAFSMKRTNTYIWQGKTQRIQTLWISITILLQHIIMCIKCSYFCT